MTVFDLKKEEQGDWFSFFNSRIEAGEIVFDKPEKDAAEFRIRGMGPFWDERRALRKKQYKMVLNPATRQMERVGYYDDPSPEEAEKDSDDAWDYAITGIKNAFSAPGVPIECNRENKLQLLKVASFLRFVSRVFQIIAEAGVKQKETESGN